MQHPCEAKSKSKPSSSTKTGTRVIDILEEQTIYSSRESERTWQPRTNENGSNTSDNMTVRASNKECNKIMSACSSSSFSSRRRDDNSSIKEDEEECPEFEMMNVTVNLLQLSGIVCEEAMSSKKTRKKTKRRQQPPSQRGRNNEEIPTFALVSFSRNALNSETSIMTHVPSLPISTLRNRALTTRRHIAKWPSDNDDETMNSSLSSVTFSRMMQRDFTSHRRDEFLPNLVDLTIGLSKQDGIMTLGTATLVLTNPTPQNHLVEIPVHKSKKIGHAGFARFLKRSKNSRMFVFRQDPSRMYAIDDNCSLKLQVTVSPHNLGQKTEDECSVEVSTDYEESTAMRNQQQDETSEDETKPNDIAMTENDLVTNNLPPPPPPLSSSPSSSPLPSPPSPPPSPHIPTTIMPRHPKVKQQLISEKKTNKSILRKLIFNTLKLENVLCTSAGGGMSSSIMKEEEVEKVEEEELQQQEEEEEPNQNLIITTSFTNTTTTTTSSSTTTTTTPSFQIHETTSLENEQDDDDDSMIMTQSAYSEGSLSIGDETVESIYHARQTLHQYAYRMGVDVNDLFQTIREKQQQQQ